MRRWLTVNKALDLILDRGSDEDKNIEPKEKNGKQRKSQYDSDQ